MSFPQASVHTTVPSSAATGTAPVGRTPFFVLHTALCIPISACPSFPAPQTVLWDDPLLVTTLPTSGNQVVTTFPTSGTAFPNSGYHLPTTNLFAVGICRRRKG